MKAKTSFSLKDQLFNPEKVNYLSGLVSSVYPAFEAEQFQHDVMVEFPQLELKERIAHITECLRKYLPDSYLEALSLLLQALPPELDPNLSDDDFGDFIFSPISLFVATYGCSQEHLKASFEALKECTKRFSAEYAIRFFINEFPEETLAFLTECATDSHYHVRRWASEGTRPKLPWAQSLVTEYTQPLPILDLLFADSTRFVTRSVANHLNDISKIDPDLVVETLQRWQASQSQEPKEMDFITRHSLRTLVKKGHVGALAMLGFPSEPNVTISELQTSTPEVKLGEAFEFSLVLTSHEDQKLLIDYVMEFATTGKRARTKVFKLKQWDAQADSSQTLRKKHRMKLMTTRSLNLGQHTITLQINGQAYDSLSFELVEP